MDSTDASPSDPGPDVERAKSAMQQLEAQLDQDANVTRLGLTRANDGRIAILVLGGGPAVPY